MSGDEAGAGGDRSSSRPRPTLHVTTEIQLPPDGIPDPHVEPAYRFYPSTGNLDLEAVAAANRRRRLERSATPRPALPDDIAPETTPRGERPIIDPQPDAGAAAPLGRRTGIRIPGARRGWGQKSDHPAGASAQPAAPTSASTGVGATPAPAREPAGFGAASPAPLPPASAYGVRQWAAGAPYASGSQLPRTPAPTAGGWPAAGASDPTRSDGQAARCAAGANAAASGATPTPDHAGWPVTPTHDRPAHGTAAEAGPSGQLPSGAAPAAADPAPTATGSLPIAYGGGRARTRREAREIACTLASADAGHPAAATPAAGGSSPTTTSLPAAGEGAPGLPAPGTPGTSGPPGTSGTQHAPGIPSGPAGFAPGLPSSALPTAGSASRAAPVPVAPAHLPSAFAGAPAVPLSPAGHAGGDLSAMLADANRRDDLQAAHAHAGATASATLAPAPGQPEAHARAPQATEASAPAAPPAPAVDGGTGPATGVLQLPGQADPTSQTASPHAPARARAATARDILTSPAFLIGAAVTLLTLLGSWFPSLWYGEAAVISGGRRSVPELAELFGSGHAAQFLPSLLAMLWTPIAGESEVLWRLPSALCTGATAAALALIGQRAATLRVGVLAAIAFVMLPRVNGMGMDAEGFALSTAAATWSAIALLWAVGAQARDPVIDLEMPAHLMPPTLRSTRRAAKRRRAGRWATYAGLIVLAGWAFPGGALVLLAQPLVLVLAGARRHALREWAVAALVAMAMLAPLAAGLILGGGLDFRSELDDLPSGWRWALEAWAPGERGLFAAIPVIATLVFGAITVRTILRQAGRTLLELALAWLLIPLAVVLVGSALAGLRAHPDWVAVTAPALALLVGLALGTAANWIAWVLVVLIVIASVPQYGTQRFPGGMHGSDLAEVASYLRTAAPDGDGVLLSGDDPVASPRMLAAAYPSAIEGLVDVGVARPAANASQLWDEQVTAGVASLRLHGIDRVWLVRDADDQLLSTDPELEAFAAEGFAMSESAVFPQHIVYQVVRTEAFGLNPDGSAPEGEELSPVPTAPPTSYPDPNQPTSTVPTTIGPDGVPTAVPQEAPAGGGAGQPSNGGDPLFDPAPAPTPTP